MRGFALTTRCPRCGTEKPTGGDAAPIVTCLKCGLGFDPKPRDPKPAPEPEPPAQELLPISTPLVDEEFDDRHALLTIRDSRFEGITLLGITALATVGMVVAGYFFYAPLFVVVAYMGLAKLIGETRVLVTVDGIVATQHPLPRRPSRAFDDGVTAADAIAGRDRELAQQLADAIAQHRARLLVALTKTQETS